jgi:hypothetical protein
LHYPPLLGSFYLLNVGFSVPGQWWASLRASCRSRLLFGRHAGVLKLFCDRFSHSAGPVTSTFHLLFYLLRCEFVPTWLFLKRRQVDGWFRIPHVNLTSADSPYAACPCHHCFLAPRNFGFVLGTRHATLTSFVGFGRACHSTNAHCPLNASALLINVLGFRSLSSTL